MHRLYIRQYASCIAFRLQLLCPVCTAHCCCVVHRVCIIWCLIYYLCHTVYIIWCEACITWCAVCNEELVFRGWRDWRPKPKTAVRSPQTPTQARKAVTPSTAVFCNSTDANIAKPSYIQSKNVKRFCKTTRAAKAKMTIWVCVESKVNLPTLLRPSL